ncbi:MAG: 4a-hydroxytetrahydrobiopterin dehydratase [Chitinivibrionales bacterium]|nr:4a-hydroxytetrahydrobiopterin dehydratase [Chitinivibrionales bacterium]MBD3395292.1 4a-hydroxytetrahydrobiopterin dehydratase [Chitinivibrionales bacterium]
MGLESKRCTPCEKGSPPLDEDGENNLLKQVPWEIDRNGTHKIRKQFTLGDFKEAMGFVNRVAELAEQEKHHPDIHISYRNVTIELSTHAVGGLSENDFILASKLDNMVKETGEPA